MILSRFDDTSGFGASGGAANVTFGLHSWGWKLLVLYWASSLLLHDCSTRPEQWSARNHEEFAKQKISQPEYALENFLQFYANWDWGAGFPSFSLLEEVEQESSARTSGPETFLATCNRELLEIYPRPPGGWASAGMYLPAPKMYLPAPRPRPVPREIIGVSAPAIIDPFDLDEALVKNGPSQGIHQGGLVRRNVNLLDRFEPPSSWEKIDNDSKHRQWGDVFQTALAARWLLKFHRLGEWELVESPSSVGGVPFLPQTIIVCGRTLAGADQLPAGFPARTWLLNLKTKRKTHILSRPIRAFWPEYLAAALRSIEFRGLGALAAQLSPVGCEEAWIEAALADAWLLLAHENFRERATTGPIYPARSSLSPLEFALHHRAKLGRLIKDDADPSERPSRRRIGVEPITRMAIDKEGMDQELQIQQKRLGMNKKRLVNRPVTLSSAGNTAPAQLQKLLRTLIDSFTQG